MKNQSVGKTGKGVEVYRSVDPDKVSTPAVPIKNENKLSKEERKEIKELYSNDSYKEKRFMGDDSSNTQIILAFLGLISIAGLLFYSLIKLFEYASK